MLVSGIGTCLSRVISIMVRRKPSAEKAAWAFSLRAAVESITRGAPRSSI